MIKYLLRVVATIVGVLALTLGVLSFGAGPASASHDNWAWSYNVDVREENTYVDGDILLWWQVGWTSMRPCPGFSIYLYNGRPDAHSARIEFVSRASGNVSWSVVINSIASHTTESIVPPTSVIAITSEPYVRYKWGDGAYGWREADYFYNWAGDTNDVHTNGYYCP